MSNLESLSKEQLKTILKLHRIYLKASSEEREEYEEDYRADLSDLDLSNITFVTKNKDSLIDLSYADLSGSIFDKFGDTYKNAYKDNYFQNNSFFCGEDLDDEDITTYDDPNRMNLKNANFSNANLSDTYFDSIDLTGANFSGADLSNAVLSHCTLKDTDFSGANLTGLRCVYTLFYDANFEGAIFADGWKITKIQE